jgi:hypothetical protein
MRKRVGEADHPSASQTGHMDPSAIPTAVSCGALIFATVLSAVI